MEMACSVTCVRAWREVPIPTEQEAVVPLSPTLDTPWLLNWFEVKETIFSDLPDNGQQMSWFIDVSSRVEGWNSNCQAAGQGQKKTETSVGRTNSRTVAIISLQEVSKDISHRHHPPLFVAEGPELVWADLRRVTFRVIYVCNALWCSWMNICDNSKVTLSFGFHLTGFIHYRRHIFRWSMETINKHEGTSSAEIHTKALVQKTTNKWSFKKDLQILHF